MNQVMPDFAPGEPGAGTFFRPNSLIHIDLVKGPVQSKM
jgi:hypothetical protein